MAVTLYLLCIHAVNWMNLETRVWLPLELNMPACLLPAPWWLIAPANPANNVYVSGMSGRRKDKGWQTFAKKVNTIDLTKDVA